MPNSTLLFIFGTRPEAIKMAPVIKEFKRNGHYEVKVCVTGQHRQMLDQVMSFFEIAPDIDLNLMKPNQSLFELTGNVLRELERVLASLKPGVVFVQGDTTTAFASALAAFYNKVPVVHIEAGLRSNNKTSPYPEEMNRVLVGALADYHFAPTQIARANLLREGMNDNTIFVVGNTVIDALFLGLKIIKEKATTGIAAYFGTLICRKTSSW
jgi:UDP-N-acetylglucosamine 2-epimerase (non-hydrolysing)